MVIRALTKTSPVSISGEGQPVPRRTGVEATSEVVPKSVCRAEAGGCRDLFDQHIDSFQQTPRLMNASLDLFAGRRAGSGSQPDSPLEGAGFEPVWGFSCQAVVLGLLPVLCSERESRS